MRRPPHGEVERLFRAWLHTQEDLGTLTRDAYVAGYMMCWKQFEEFVKSEIGEEGTSLGQGTGERFFDREGNEIEGPGGRR